MGGILPDNLLRLDYLRALVLELSALCQWRRDLWKTRTKWRWWTDCWKGCSPWWTLLWDIAVSPPLFLRTPGGALGSFQTTHKRKTTLDGWHSLPIVVYVYRMAVLSVILYRVDVTVTSSRGHRHNL